MIKEYTCIVCPNGCDIRAEVPEDGGDVRIEGARCSRGKAYVLQELKDPRRTISTSMAVRDGELALASVRLTSPIPLARISEAVEQIHKIVLDAPVAAGDKIIRGLLDMDCDVVVTRSVARRA